MNGEGRDAIVATAAESIAKGSLSFAAASKLFDRRTRERVWMLYAWCRRCDDLCDGQDHGMRAAEAGPGADDPGRALGEIRAKTAAALAGDVVGDPAFDALRIVAAEAGLPAGLVAAHVEGFALDAQGWRPETESDLLRYCWHVAGVVGGLMALIMGVRRDDAATLERAADLGIAFQLANIARDIVADDRAGRCYLPRVWLAEAGLAPETMTDPAMRARLAMLARRLAVLAGRHEASARIGAARLPFRSRWAVLAAAGIYGDIARQVAARGERAWDERIVIGAGAKAGWVARALAQAVADRPGGTPRGTLWTPPLREALDG